MIIFPAYGLKQGVVHTQVRASCMRPLPSLPSPPFCIFPWHLFLSLKSMPFITMKNKYKHHQPKFNLFFMVKTRNYFLSKCKLDKGSFD